MSAAWLGLARAFFEGALRLLLPAAFRDAVGRELREAFADQSRDHLERFGPASLVGLLMHVTWDLLRVGLQERRWPTVGHRVADGKNGEGRTGRTTMRFDALMHDLKHATRALRREPGFTLIAILMLAVGIGGTTGVYTIVHKLLIAPLPGIEEPDRLVALGVTSPASSFSTFPHPVYTELRDRIDAFDAVMARSRIGLSLGTDGPPQSVSGEIVSGNYFTGLGVPFELGRGFTPDETAVVGGPLVTVVSHRAWVDRFGADPGIVGRAVTLNGAPFTIVGVAGLDFVGLSIDGPVPDFWVPLSTQPTAMPWEDGVDPLTSMGDSWLFVAARLSDGVTLRQAEAAVQAFGVALQEALPDGFADYGVAMTPNVAIPNPGQRSEIATILGTLMAVVGLLLAIVCSNLASLFLARAATRRRDMGIRLSLGSSRGRVVRQLLFESSLIGTMGGLLGLLLAEPVSSLVLELYGRSIVVPMDADLGVATFALLLSVGTGVLFGLSPALSASRSELARTLGKGGAASRAHPLARSALTVAQLSLSAVLLVGSALFARSLANIASTDPGFDPGGLVTARVTISPLELSEAEARDLYGRLVEQAEAIAGVRAATLSLNAPFSGAERGGGFEVPGRPAEDGVGIFNSSYNVLWPGYFTTMGTPLLRGRDFTASDGPDAPLVAIVTESLAERVWPGEDPLGQRISRGEGDIEVIGVVGDSKFGSLAERPRTFFFLPLLQRNETRATIMVRAAGPPSALVAPLREALQAVEPDLPALRVSTLESMMSRSLARYRLAASATGAFTLLAIVLAALGLYGLLSYGVTQRRQEIGVRMALGARREQVTGMITRRGLQLGALGLALGLIGAATLSRFVGPLLFSVSPLDPVSFGSAAALILVVATLACWLPARRASRVDPAEALRLD